jgi:hypothetical protein
MLCRELKEMTRSLRERALKSLYFLRTLCWDLETSALYQWYADGNADVIVNTLLVSNYTQLSLNKVEDCNFLVLCPNAIVRENDYIDSILNATFQHGAALPTADHSLNSAGGCLVLIPVKLVSTTFLRRPGRPSITLGINTRLNLSHCMTVSALKTLFI